jgi:3',5'-cyclic AMP phosphodiesterase CpdA
VADQTIIHLSDLHVGKRPIESRRTRSVFDHIAANYPGKPVVITGDLTDSATRSQFRRARQLLDDLAGTNPILTVPGNHDYAWLGNFLNQGAWADWVRYLGSPLGWGRAERAWMGVDHEPRGIDGLGVWKHGQCVYFGIDSGDPEDKKNWAVGYISRELAKALKESLEKYRGRTRIVLLHHHPFTEGVFTRLEGSARLLAATRDNCELLLFGHHHQYGLWRDKRGVELITSSHKTTDPMSGRSLMITLIEIADPGTPDLSFSHRIEVL